MFHLKLKGLREKIGLTQQQLAEKLNITRSSLSLYEIGKRQPDYEILKAMALFFDVSVDFLLEVENSKYKTTQADNEDKLLKDSAFLEAINNLSDESKKELEHFIKLLKIKDMYNENSNNIEIAK